jgi:hypothetical protein
VISPPRARTKAGWRSCARLTALSRALTTRKLNSTQLFNEINELLYRESRLTKEETMNVTGTQTTPTTQSTEAPQTELTFMPHVELPNQSFSTQRRIGFPGYQLYPPYVRPPSYQYQQTLIGMIQNMMDMLMKLMQSPFRPQAMIRMIQNTIAMLFKMLQATMRPPPTTPWVSQRPSQAEFGRYLGMSGDKAMSEARARGISDVRVAGPHDDTTSQRQPNRLIFKTDSQGTVNSMIWG